MCSLRRLIDNYEDMADQEIIQNIKSGAGRRMSAIRALYQRDGLKDKIRAFVRSNSGNDDDAEDVFHDGIIILDRNIRNGQYRAESRIDVYLYSICKYAWMNKIRKNKRVVHGSSMDLLDREDDQPADRDLYHEELNEHLDRLLEQVTERCRKIFSMWKLDYSMKEIATALNLSSARLARKYKYRCMKRLIRYLEKNPSYRKSIESLLYG